MTDDLVSRLLAAIQEREDKARAEGHYDPDEGGYYACPATRSEPYGDLPFGEENCDCGLAKRRDEALRLCQAHRKVIDQYQAAKAKPDELLAKRAHGSYVLEANAVVEALTAVIVSLAEGYGIEPSTSANFSTGRGTIRMGDE